MTIQRVLRLVPLAVIAGVVACADRSGGIATMTVHDSAGVRIVETVPEVWPPPEVWQVSDTPSVDIGVREGDPDYELFQVQGAVGLPDGGTVIAEFGSRLRYYDAEGMHVRTLDRRGEGPGEAGAFSGISGYRGDSLVLETERMYGTRSRTRLLILALDGTYGRDVMAWYPGSAERNPAWIWTGASGGIAAPLEDGSFVLAGATRMDLVGSLGDILPGRTALLRLDATAERVDTIGNVTTRLFERRAVDNRQYELVLGVPDAPSVRSRAMLVYHTSGERFTVDVFEPPPMISVRRAEGPSSQPVRSYRVLAPLSPSTPDSRETYISQLIDIFRTDGTVESRARYRARLESLRSPDSLPAVQDLRVDALGNVWLEMYASPGASSREYARSRAIDIETGPSPWIVLDPEGRLLGSVLLPEGLEVFEIGADYVLGIWYDEFGVEHVRRHSILKSD